jgi:hypothetical protein
MVRASANPFPFTHTPIRPTQRRSVSIDSGKSAGADTLYPPSLVHAPLPRSLNCTHVLLSFVSPVDRRLD